MGYWWPPSLLAFDPSERVLIGPVNGQPHPLDVEMISYGLVRSWPLVKSLGYAGALSAIWEARDPNIDPPTGGLPPDDVLEDGTIRVNYYDLADGHRAWRKRARYVPKGDTYVLDARTINGWNYGGVPELYVPGQGWTREGADAEREFGKSGVSFITALVSILAAVAGMAAGGAGAVFFSTFMSLWNVGIKAGSLGRPPSIDEIAGALAGTAGGAAKGVMGVLAHNPDLQKAFQSAFIGDMAKEGQRLAAQADKLYKEGRLWADKLSVVVTNGGKYLPPVNLTAMVPGFNMQQWAAGQLSALKGAVQAPTHFGRPSNPVPLSNPQVPDNWPWSMPSIFRAAGEAFLEPDPRIRLAMRRNFILRASDSSNWLTHGNAQGWAHGEMDEGLGVQGVATYFDEFLASMFAEVEANLLNAQLRSKEELGSAIILFDPRKLDDPTARKKLLEMTTRLMRRYGMS